LLQHLPVVRDRGGEGGFPVAAGPLKAGGDGDSGPAPAAAGQGLDGLELDRPRTKSAKALGA
jgi:hypothetical protein